jgi:hypothetical protein
MKDLISSPELDAVVVNDVAIRRKPLRCPYMRVGELLIASRG